MKRSLHIYILGCFLTSIGIVAGLMSFSKSFRQQPGSFLRELPPHPALEENVFDLGFDSYYIAGATPTAVYLGNLTSPLELLEIRSLSPLDTQHVRIHLPGAEQLRAWSPKVRVDSPRFYFADGVVPMLYHGRVGEWIAIKADQSTAYFHDLVPISNGEVAIRTRSLLSVKNVLGKIDVLSGHTTLNDNLLIPQVDGVFCTDGMLHYSSQIQSIVYLYYYRNEILVVDRNLQLRNKWHTIDTVSKAQIRVAAIETDSSIVLAAPPLTVNRRSSVDGTRLYVNSALRASNETTASFAQGAVIDTYDLKTGQYVFSFYIYDYKNIHLDQFKVVENRVYALLGSYLQMYSLRPQYAATTLAP